MEYEIKINSDANPKELAEQITIILDAKKARNIKMLKVEEQTILADYFIICCGTSNTQIRALAGEVEEKLGEIGITPHHIEGYNEGSWVILDYSSVIVHIFNRESRDFYNLEKLWGDAEDVDLTPLFKQEQ